MGYNKEIFTGTATALITPFKDGGVDFTALGNLIEFQIEKGIDALLFCGTTGESSTMPDEEHMTVIRYGIEKIAGRVPLIANTGSNDTAHAIDLSKQAEEAGADALLSVAPYYNKSTQRGLTAHFSAIANSTSLPIILYNVPARTVVNIDASTIIGLSEIPNIVAVKECNLSQVTDVIYGTGDDFTVYSGCDEMVLEFMALGAKGLISVMSNIIPAEACKITKTFLSGDALSSMKAFYDIYPLLNALGLETNPIPIKKASALMDMSTGNVRLPLVEMDENNASILDMEMKKLALI